MLIKIAACKPQTVWPSGMHRATAPSSNMVNAVLVGLSQHDHHKSVPCRVVVNMSALCGGPLQACQSAMCCAIMTNLRCHSTHASATRGGAWTEPDKMYDPVTIMQASTWCLPEVAASGKRATDWVSIPASRRVLERVTKDSCSGAGNRAAATFQEDDGIDARFRNKLTDFQMSGYDRGHMVGLRLQYPWV